MRHGKHYAHSNTSYVAINRQNVHEMDAKRQNSNTSYVAINLKTLMPARQLQIPIQIHRMLLLILLLAVLSMHYWQIQIHRMLLLILRFIL